MASGTIPLVSGYLYVNQDDPRRHYTVCEILERRDDPNGPAFLIEFADGTLKECLGEELHPWFATRTTI